MRSFLIFVIKLSISFMLLLVSKTGHASVNGQIYYGNPDNYRTLLSNLQQGDTLLLEAGDYLLGLPVHNLNGVEGNPIIVSGPETGPAAIFHPRSCCNTVSILDSSYIEIRNLEVDGAGTSIADGVKAEGHANWAHHITLENLYIHDHDGDQQIVGISTKCPTWNWVIRRNIIEQAGTGMYLGNSNGADPFVKGLIEGNLIVDTLGYNMQIKHQTGRPDIPGIPASGTTIIRHNVFSKANNASTGGMARPNLLVGHWPPTGAGAGDFYLIYGNFIFSNPSGEPLFQGEGNVALYNNLFVNPVGSAIWVQPHNDVPKEIRIFNNTIVAQDQGIRVSGGDPAAQQIVTANAVFAGTPLNGGNQIENIVDSYTSADNYLTNPFASPGQLDLYPLPGTLAGSPIDTSQINQFLDWDRDFNNDLHDGTFRGAYAGEGTNSGWLPDLEPKPLGDIIISGKVTAGGDNLSGVSLSAGGATCTDTNSIGDYQCFITQGWSGTLTPSKFGYSFAPANRTYSDVVNDTPNQDYTASFLLLEEVYLPIINK
jgi:hypothetical protein